MNRGELITRVRDFIRDKRELNRLLDNDYETSQRQLELAVDMCLDDYNNTPPRLGVYTTDNFPWIYLLIIGSAVQVLKSAGIMHSRNHLNYSDGGLTVATDEQATYYVNWLNVLGQEYEEKKMRAKQSENLDQCWSI